MPGGSPTQRRSVAGSVFSATLALSCASHDVTTGVVLEGSGGDTSARGNAGGDVAPDAGVRSGSGGDSAALEQGLDGYKPIHPLNATQYANTLQDLFGASFAPDAVNWPEQNGFLGNQAGAVYPAASFFETALFTAERYTDRVWDDAALRSRVVTCAPASEGDATCAADILRAFGKRAFRRPVTDAEVETYLQVYDASLEENASHEEAIKNVVVALLCSAELLFRIEYDEPEDGRDLHPLSDYELATRLSYFLWDTMPDAQLFELAEAGELHEPVRLAEQVSRLLIDERSKRMVDQLMMKWLQAERLENHPVDLTLFPEYTSTLEAAMLQEARSYFQEFLSGRAPYSEFLSADFTYLDQQLAELYGVPVPAQPWERVTLPSEPRFGYFGKAAFLTFTSQQSRTSPDSRGSFVVENVLCDEPPPSFNQASVSQLEEPSVDTEPRTIREALERQRRDPACASCHVLIDPLGLAMEQFDAIGRYREAYPNGEVIDTSGSFSREWSLEGKLVEPLSFSGLADLVHILEQDPRYYACAVDRMITFGLGRPLAKEEEPVAIALAAKWRPAPTLPSLIHLVTELDAFRMRQAKDAPEGSP